MTKNQEIIEMWQSCAIEDKEDLEKINTLKDSICDTKGNYNEITLKKITQENYEQCIELSVNENQSKFVASNIYSLVQTAYEPDLYPLAVYQGSTMVGFILYDFDQELDAWSMSRFMIDKKYQGQGIGKLALEKFITFFITTYGSVPLYTSAGVENIAAIHLYQKFGFEKLNTFSYTIKDVVYTEIRMLLK